MYLPPRELWEQFEKDSGVFVDAIPNFVQSINESLEMMLLPPAPVRPKEITLWKRKNKDVFEYNHYEEGHSTASHPKVKVTGSVQEGWKKSVWEKEWAFLSSGKIYIRHRYSVKHTLHCCLYCTE